jgi:hypothetical protein
LFHQSKPSMKGRELPTPSQVLLHHIGVCVFPLMRPNAKAFAEMIGPMIALAAIDDGRVPIKSRLVSGGHGKNQVRSFLRTKQT